MSTESPPTEPTPPASGEGAERAAAGRAQRAFALAERLTDFGADAFRRWLIPAALIMGAPAWFLWPLLSDAAYLRTNEMPFTDRLWLSAAVGGSVLLVGLVYLSVGWRGWRKTGTTIAVHDRLVGLNKKLLGLIVLPILPIFKLGLAKDHQVMALFLAVVCGVGAGIAAYFFLEGAPARVASWWEQQPEQRRTSLSKVATVGPAVLLGVLALLYSWFVSKWSIGNHHAMATGVYDLGIYIQIFWQSLHGNFLGCTFALGETHVTAHFDPILIPLSAVLLLYDGVESIYVLQTVWLASAVVPLYLIGARHKPWLGLLLGTVYLLHPALHGPNLFDFHSLMLSIPCSAWAAYFAFDKRWKPFAVAIVFLLLVREDMALVTVWIGMSLIISRVSTRAGLITIASGIVYFLIVKLFFMKSPRIFMTGGAYNYSDYYAELMPDRNGAGGIILSVLSNPQFLLKLVLSETKLLFFTQLFAPVLWVSFFARRHKFLMLYGLLFTLLGSRWALPNIHYQYTATLLPFLVALVPSGMEGAANTIRRFAPALDDQRFRAALAVAILTSSLCVTGKFGTFVDNHFARPRPSVLWARPSAEEKERYDWLQETIATHIPDDASVAATKRTATHVALRREVWHFPHRLENADFLLTWDVDLRDRREGKANKQQVKQLLRTKQYAPVAEKYGLHLYKRTDDAAKAYAEQQAAKDKAAKDKAAKDKAAKDKAAEQPDAEPPLPAEGPIRRAPKAAPARGPAPGATPASKAHTIKPAAPPKQRPAAAAPEDGAGR